LRETRGGSQPYRAGVQILLPDLLTQTEEVIQLWG
ncbi:tail protein X, partial [Pseudomonas amygdali pv. mori str. 301020]